MSDHLDWGYDDTAKVTSLPLIAQPAGLPDPTKIPPRQWLYGTRLIRRFVTVLVAPGGTGKSMFGIGVAMSLAAGKPLLGDNVWQSVPGWIMNLEDPLDELDRRVAAMMIQHQVARDELVGRLFINSGRDRRVMVAQQSDYGTVWFPDKQAIIDTARARGIGYICVDPFVKSHGLDENNNGDMDKAATAWAEIADQCDCAIDLIHHTRKSNGGPIDVDSARGGKALTDASRVSQTLSVMTSDEASKMGVAEDQRKFFVRLDDAKSNMAPAASARWFALVPVNLGNATPEYPSGDTVGAITPWTPPAVFEGLEWQTIEGVLEEIEKGPEPGEYYTLARSSRDQSRWAGTCFIGRADKTPGQVGQILAAWEKSGLLERGSYMSPSQRKTRACVRVNTNKLSEMRHENARRYDDE